jgi:dTDP-4-amino-4,6-dideoxygalactose transaminase
MDPKYYHKAIGGNFRLDALQAAMLSIKLLHFDGYTEARQRNARLYTEKLVRVPGIVEAGPEDCGCARATVAAETTQVILPVAYPHNGHIWNQYTLRVPGAGRRDALRAHLTARGIGSEIYYPLPLHEQECYASLGVKADSLPVAKRLAGEVLSLPIYPEIPAEQIARVCEVIEEFVSDGKVSDRKAS